MKMSRVSTCLAAACIAAVPATVWANDSTLVLVMGGEAYDGPPQFEVDFDGKPLGKGTVAAAIDTSNGRFADASDKTQYVQNFSFTVPEAVFRPDGTIKVKLLNEANGGDGSNRDRNLYLASVALNGRTVTVSGLTTQSGIDQVPSTLLGEFLVIPDGSRDGVSMAPKGGWPAPAQPAAAAQPIDPVTTGSTSEEPLQVASLNQDPEGNSSGCDLDQIYNVIGFNDNSNDLTSRLADRLDQVVADIGGRQCNVAVTGYSDRQGATATNALFAIERAQNSLRYLQEHGVRFVRASATGVGATDRFGPAFALNRRVVIAITP